MFMKINDKYYYPWLSVWQAPRKTIDHVMQSDRFKSIFFFLVLINGVINAIEFAPEGRRIIPISLAAITFVVFLFWVIAGFFYWLGKLFHGQATFKEVLTAVLLSTIPSMVDALVRYLIGDTFVYTSNAIFSVWALSIFVVMYAHVEKISLWKSTGVTALLFLLFAAIGFWLYTDEERALDDFNATIQAELIRDKIQKNASPKTIASLVTAGYSSLSLRPNDKDFLTYSDKVFDLFVHDVAQRDAMKKRNKMWLGALSEGNITQEKLDPFFEQVVALNDGAGEGNTTWSVILDDLPDDYMDFMEKKLREYSRSDRAVPLVTLYTQTGEEIRDMNHSRRYFISEVHKRMAEFYDEEQECKTWAAVYAERGMKYCTLNPDLLFMLAYYDDNATANVQRYDTVMKLITKSNDLLGRYETALYNNLAFQITEANMTQRYDEAIGYLQKAYDADHTMVYSLSNIAVIYDERGELKRAYKMLEEETFRLFGLSDQEIKEKETNYWVFARKLIELSYRAKDYETTRYLCGRYLSLIDGEYQECVDDLEKIKAIPSQAREEPLYPMWQHYHEKRAKQFVTQEGNTTDTDYAKTEQFLWKTYVPDRGQSETLQGELLRAITRLQDEAQSNGNENWDAGYEMLLVFLKKTLDEAALTSKNRAQLEEDIQKLSQPKEPYMEDDVYERIRHRVVEYYWRHPVPIPRKIDPNLKR
jgi:hypothetical protein